MSGSRPDLERRSDAIALRLAGHTFSEIGRALGVTTQRAQQITHAPKSVRTVIVERAGGACEACGKRPGKSGHIHHRVRQGMTPETYNGESNLAFLCTSCHTKAHVDPSFAEQRRQHATPEARARRETLRAYRVGAHRLGISVDEYRQHREAGERWCSAHKRWEPADLFGARQRVCIDGNRERVRRYQTREYTRDYYRRNRARLNAYQAAWRQQRQERQAAF